MAFAYSGEYEVMLQDADGKMLSEVSSATSYNGYVLFIAQNQDVVYYVKENELNDVFIEGDVAIKLRAVKLTGQLPKYISWEAITLGVKDKELTMFLTHEHDEDGDVHQAYQANVSLNQHDVVISPVKPLGLPLPISSNQSIPMRRRVNYGYESISWDEVNQTLIAVSELSEQGVMFVSEKEQISKFEDTKHSFRLSDMEMVSESCAVFTSFCHTSDNVCKANDQSSILSVITATISEQLFSILDSKDISTNHLNVGFDPLVSERTDKGRLFNAEGITMFKQGILLVNDNYPQGKARTAARYIPSISVDRNTCKIEYKE